MHGKRREKMAWLGKRSDSPLSSWPVHPREGRLTHGKVGHRSGPFSKEKSPFSSVNKYFPLFDQLMKQRKGLWRIGSFEFVWRSGFLCLFCISFVVSVLYTRKDGESGYWVFLVCVHAIHMCACLFIFVRAYMSLHVGCPGTRVTQIRVLPNVTAGNLTQVFCKNSKCS